ncbi:glycosyltransferase [Marinobacter zhejiangensis]|uniref:Glycosyltransferase involved in cell wall bisynthesis n=1 Tax=Marinobacter zhejiangensis TaxID=488535 RepID=A0A1I4RNK1_9GAMM|nr:glycosyltransferase [Marinobacter zhejiangensis]SFM53716.1 Glycosyltransferase involved in cell wall bisynthesis [Marinobacter zhejiangensis]
MTMTNQASPLVVTHIVSGDIWAGAEAQVYTLCKALAETNGIVTTAVVFNEGILSQKLQALGIHVEIADETRLNGFQIIGRIRRHCLDYKTQVVHTHGFKENVLGIAGKELARVPSSVRTIHGNPETQAKSLTKRLTHKLDIVLSRYRQQAIIAVSTQLYESLTPLFPGKVHKIFNFIDIDALRRSHAAMEIEPVPSATKVLGIVGRLMPVKRIDIFIKTIAELNRQGICCLGVIIGSGPLEAELKQLVQDLDIGDLISFKGFVNPAFQEIRELDVLLMTSDHEGLPMTLLEALALETPVVAHCVGGIPEVLGNGANGWLVDAQSPQTYASKLAPLLEDDSLLRSKVAAGLTHVNNFFGVGANTKKYVELYNRHRSVTAHQ